MVEPIITARDLKIVYNLGKSNEYVALRVDHFEIFPQEYIILFGPSGCGKSTLLYCLLGILPPTSGEYQVHGENPYAYSPERKVRFQQETIGIIYQSFNLIPSISVLDNVALPRIFANDPKPKREQRAMMLLRRFGIEAQAKKLPQNLSGGQQQRIAVARSLVSDPEILLADEPVGNLDSVSTMQVMNTLGEINKYDKKTIVLVTHDAKFLPFAHRTYYLKDGYIEREVINPEMPQIKKVKSGSTILTEVEKLARIYPYSTAEELRVKSIINYLTQELSFDQLERLEKLILMALEGRVSAEEMLGAMGQSFEHGGVGLSRARAKEMAGKLTKMLTEAREVRRYRRDVQEKAYASRQTKRIQNLRTSLLDEYPGQIDLAGLERLEEAIAKRVAGLVTMEEFESFLMRPVEDRGMGFDSGVSIQLARYLEKLIAQGVYSAT
jgi:putative ABC transport system ATP-binding protein